MSDEDPEVPVDEPVDLTPEPEVAPEPEAPTAVATAVLAPLPVGVILS